MKDLFNKIKKFFLEIKDRINEIDIPDGYDNLTKEQRAELDNTYKVQLEVHKQKSFVPKVEVNENKAQVTARGKAPKNKGDIQIIHENA